MSLSFHNIHLFLIKWGGPMLLSLVVNINPAHDIEGHKLFSKQVSQAKGQVNSLKKLFISKKKGYQKILIWIGGTSSIIGIGLFTIYKLYKGSQGEVVKGNKDFEESGKSSDDNNDENLLLYNHVKYESKIPDVDQKENNDSYSIERINSDKDRDHSSNTEKSTSEKSGDDRNDIEKGTSNKNSPEKNPNDKSDNDGNSKPQMKAKNHKNRKQDNITISPIGFQNTGNSCFLNALIQVLVNVITHTGAGNIKAVIDWQKKLKNDKTDEAEVTKAFSRLVEAITDENKKNSPNTIKEPIRALREKLGKINPDLSSGIQYDAWIAMSITLNTIDSSFNKIDEQLSESYDLNHGIGYSIATIKKEIDYFQEKIKNSRSVIGKLFDSTYAEVEQCTECGFTYLVLKKKRIITVPLVNQQKLNQATKSLEESLELLESPIKNARIDHHHHEHCAPKNNHLSKKIRQEKILVPGNILILGLDATGLDANGQSIRVPHQEISYPLHLKNGKYELISSIVHLGSNIKFGHYISFVKDQATGKWREINDSHVKIANEVLVQNIWKYPSSKATPRVLIYKRKSFTSLSKTNSLFKVSPLLLAGSNFRHLAFDQEGENWVKGQKGLKKLWEKIKQNIKTDKSILQALQKQLFTLFSNSLQKSCSHLKSTYPTLSKLVNRFEQKVAEHGMQEDPILLQMISDEIKKWGDMEELLYYSFLKLTDPMIDAIKTRIKWLEGIPKKLDTLSKKKPPLITIENQLAHLMLPLREELLTLQKLILSELKKEISMKSNLENSISNKSSIASSIYTIMNQVILETYLQKEQSSKTYLGAHLDLVNYILGEIGYVVPLF